MVSDKEKYQDQVNHGSGLEPAGDTRSDEQGLSAVSVRTLDNDVSGTEGIANQSDPVVVPPNESLDTQVILEKQEQMNVVRETLPQSPSSSPTGNGSHGSVNKDEGVLVTNTEDLALLADVNEQKGAVTETELELLPQEKGTTQVVDDDDTELNRVMGMDRPQLELELDILNEEVPEFKASGNQKSFLLEPNSAMEDEPGTEEDQAAFMKELEIFHKERCLEFKPPRFYGEPLNCLKLWRSVIRLGGYEQVTSCKLWRQVGESFKPPKTCTTVSWTFRCFYEKALLEYEKYMMSIGELPFTDASSAEPANGRKQELDSGRKIRSIETTSLHLTPGSGRARRDAAARAMQGWHSQRLLGNGEVGDPIIKDKNSGTILKREKQFKGIGLLKRKKPSSVERAVKVARMKASKPQLDSMIVDIGPPADWVKINVQRTKDCFEVYALVPGLLREEVRVQSDPAGRLVISGQPEQLENPWGVTPFKKVVSLPSRIDPHQTSAVVTLHGQLFVRVPFEQLDL